MLSLTYILRIAYRMVYNLRSQIQNQKVTITTPI